MKEFQAEVANLTGIHLSTEQIAAFLHYEEELSAWNKKFNLTTLVTPQEIRVKHFLDSLSCLQVINKCNSFKLIDVGTGAGFPSIPIKIILPKIKLTLIESIQKKANFCHHIVKELNLQEVEILNARAENIGQDRHYREQFDWAVARAVASLPTLVEYLLPLVKKGGKALAQKGKNANKELQIARNAIQILGGELGEIRKVDIPSIKETRFLVVIKKVSSCPLKYPRRAGVPAKKPL